MHPETARLIAGQRCAELVVSRRRSRRSPAGPPPAAPPAASEPGCSVVLGRPARELAGRPDPAYPAVAPADG